jgi:Protein of unknown function (DUF4058)
MGILVHDELINCMPIQTRNNQFLGINPHLHSFWQANSLWNRFHSFHIAQIMSTLKQTLITMGYTAETEEALQIRCYNPEPQNSLSLKELEGEINDENPYTAIGIYELKNYEHGELVAWLELLSPTNKGNSRDANAYQQKRRTLLKQGIVFVEVDYLHETPSTFANVPDYTKQEPYATPYNIITLDPRPNFSDTRGQIYSFQIDEPLPIVPIQLNGEDVIEVDFDFIYQKTFVDGVYGFDMSYDTFPMNMSRYSAQDQARSVTRMLHVLQTTDLTPMPKALETLDLATALEQLQALGIKQIDA